VFKESWYLSLSSSSYTHQNLAQIELHLQHQEIFNTNQGKGTKTPSPTIHQVSFQLPFHLINQTAYLALLVSFFSSPASLPVPTLVFPSHRLYTSSLSQRQHPHKYSQEWASPWQAKSDWSNKRSKVNTFFWPKITNRADPCTCSCPTATFRNSYLFHSSQRAFAESPTRLRAYGLEGHRIAERRRW